MTRLRRHILPDGLADEAIASWPGVSPGETIVAHTYTARGDVAASILTNPDNRQFNPLLSRMEQRPGSWLKYIYYEALGASGQVVRWWTELSIRPYIQGDGCDGTTDNPIHAIANRLAAAQGISYKDLLRAVYPEDDDNTSFLTDPGVLAEAHIPAQIDPWLALDDLMNLNNYDLAERLGDELVTIGIVPPDWLYRRQGDAWEAKKAQAVVAYKNAWEAVAPLRSK